MAFYSCIGLEGITIPESVTSIGEEAFCWCTFSSVTIPETVAQIGNKAFYIDNLTKATILGQNTELGEELFKRYDVAIYCHQGSTAATWAEDWGYEPLFLENMNLESDCIIKISSLYRLGCGYSVDLHPTIIPIGDPSLIQWSVSDPDVVTVENGVVTALSEGTVTITASYGSNSKSFSVTTYIPAEQIILECTEKYGLVDHWVSVPSFTCIPENSKAYLTWDYEFLNFEGGACKRSRAGVIDMTEKKEKQWLSVEDVAEMLQVKRPCAKRKMKEMADCVNLGSEKYQILMVSLPAFNAWMRNHRLVTP